MQNILVCQNNSPMSTQFCVYQRFKKPSNAASLAWICQACASRAKTRFQWDDTPCFIWGFTQNLYPGTDLLTVQYQPIHEAENVRLSQQPDGCFAFRPAPTGTPGPPTIITDGTVPASSIAVGLGMRAECMCDTAALAVCAGPNGRYPFDTEVEYYLAAVPGMNLLNGDVLDLSSINSAKITFPYGRHQLIATLDESNQIKFDTPRTRSTMLF